MARKYREYYLGHGTLGVELICLIAFPSALAGRTGHFLCALLGNQYFHMAYNTFENYFAPSESKKANFCLRLKRKEGVGKIKIMTIYKRLKHNRKLIKNEQSFS